MPALVRSEGNGLHIFLYRAINDLLNSPVMPQVDHFCSARLQDTAHDVYGCIMPVEQGSCRDNPDMILRFIRFG